MPSGAFFNNQNYLSLYRAIMKLTKFLKETKGEMKQVTWPSRRHLVIYTLVVIIFSAALAYLLGAFDSLFQAGLRALIF
ncbi:preprotein translocase subunit SecE [Candidatus Nomurabacteria bacterium]|nr:preprotein translocase subunit SecE [Candidatus Nomurabacteria bacterium]